MLTLPEVAQRFSARQQGAGFMARCPAHDDSKASLSISAGDDGKILLRCHAGCSFDAITQAASIKPTDLFPASTKVERRIVATYDYRDEAGELLYQSLRYDPKDFRQRDANKNWTTAGIRRVLYRLPEITATDTEQTIFVVEGEKDADQLAANGVLATTNVSGAGKWLPEYSDSLVGRNLVLIPDNDDPGRAHMQAAAKMSHGKAASVRVLALPGLPNKGDVSDWLNNGGTIEELLELADNAPLWKPSEPVEQYTAANDGAEQPHTKEPAIVYESVTLAELEHVPEPEYFIPGILERSQPGVIAGQFKSLKTTIAAELCYCLVTQKPFLGAYLPVRKFRVGMFSGESGPAQFSKLIKRIGEFHLDFNPWQHEGLITSFKQLPKIGHIEYMDALVRWIETNKLELCIIDPGYAAMSEVGDGAGNYYRVAKLLFQITELQQKTGCCILIAPHMTKAPKYDPPLLSDIQWSGFAEWAGQWILNGKRREWDDKTGQHWLWMVFGGRSGHATTIGLDVLEGKEEDDGGKVFQPEIIDRDEAFHACRDAVKQKKAHEHAADSFAATEAIRAAFRAAGPGDHIKSQILEATGLSPRGKAISAAWGNMLRVGEIKLNPDACQGGNNKACDGYSYHPKD